MKTIGPLGGMSWESSALYYKIINEEIKKLLGGLHSAKIVLLSVDFEEIEKLQAQGDWKKAGELLGEAAKNIQNAGADFLLICTNTMHKIVHTIEKNIDIPILHIADATALALQKDGIDKVALLGTAFTMKQDFYKDRLSKKFAIEVLIPNEKDIKIIHDVIYEELCLGVLKEKSKKEYLRIIDNLSQKGAKAVILGCTEIGMLVSAKDTNVKLYDTTLIHAKYGARFSLEN